MKFGVVIFPGSNCDQDAYYAVKTLGKDVDYIWHASTDVSGFDCIILPGGFSYGDYLRTGAVAKFSPVMNAIKDFAAKGGRVIGICNGFQILCESGLLPGALISNTGLRFICKHVNLRVENDTSDFTNLCKKGDVLSIPIAHHGGNYYADDDTLKSLEDNGQVLFRYCDAEGNVTDEANPNGSRNNIAGILSAAGNVAGMMPHPERAMEKILTDDDGKVIFESIINRLS